MKSHIPTRRPTWAKRRHSSLPSLEVALDVEGNAWAFVKHHVIFANHDVVYVAHSHSVALQLLRKAHTMQAQLQHMHNHVFQLLAFDFDFDSIRLHRAANHIIMCCVMQ